MQKLNCESCGLLERSSLYQEYLAERDEILRHKWIESEKAGGDIGFERALVSWAVLHRSQWRKERRGRADPAPAQATKRTGKPSP